MSFGRIKYELRGEVSIIRLDQPDTLNAVDTQMVEEIDRAVDRALTESRSLILTSVGRAFSSGAGLAGGIESGNGSEPDLGITLETHINPLMSKLRRLPIPWISAVRGAAAGVGCSFALAADLVIAGESAYFLQAFARVGLVPDGGSSHLLARGLSRVRAMEMMMLGERIPARQALAWGLINRVVEDAALDDVALELATTLSAGPTRAYAFIRDLAWSALDSNWETALARERELQRSVSTTYDAVEGIAAFMEKRPARFLGR